MPALPACRARTASTQVRARALIRAAENGKQVTAVVEIKARRGRDFGLPQEAVNARKLSKLRELAQTYRLLHPRVGVGLRIDVVAVAMDRAGASRGCFHIAGVALD